MQHPRDTPDTLRHKPATKTCPSARTPPAPSPTPFPGALGADRLGGGWPISGVIPRLMSSVLCLCRGCVMGVVNTPGLGSGAGVDARAPNSPGAFTHPPPCRLSPSRPPTNASRESKARLAPRRRCPPTTEPPAPGTRVRTALSRSPRTGRAPHVPSAASGLPMIRDAVSEVSTTQLAGPSSLHVPGPEL